MLQQKIGFGFVFRQKLQSIFSQLKKHQLFLILSIGFFLLYCLLSLLKHYNFDSNAYDLGIFNQTLYHYAHLKLGPNTLRSVPILLADHFELLLFLFAPLYWIFGSYALLVVQMFSILFGALGIYLFVSKETQNKMLTLGAVFVFYLSFGVLSAVDFDYHNNVVGIMLLPWLFYSLSLAKYRWYYLFLALLLVSKESLSLISAFLGISIFFLGDSKQKKHGLITFFVSICYFIVILKVVIPFFNHGNYDHWSYDALGSSPVEAIKNIILHPFFTLQLLFNDQVKVISWVIFLASGGIFCFLKPRYGLLIIPVLAQKFFSSNQVFWGILYQYSIEFAPIVAIALPLTLFKIQNLKIQKVFLGLFIASNIAIFILMCAFGKLSLNKLFQKDYYLVPDKQSLYQAMDMIGNSSVSAQTSLVSHLAGRDKIYVFPFVEQSEFVLLDMRKNANIWPMKDQHDFQEIVKIEVDQNRFYRKIYERNNIVLYQRRN